MVKWNIIRPFDQIMLIFLVHIDQIVKHLPPPRHLSREIEVASLFLFRLAYFALSQHSNPDQSTSNSSYEPACAADADYQSC
jgi:hypothetical protein